MNRKKIEENDQLLLQKIREIIHNKEEKPGKKKPVPGRFGFWLPALLAGLVITGLITLREQPKTVVSSPPAPPSTDVANKVDPVPKKNTVETSPPVPEKTPLETVEKAPETRIKLNYTMESPVSASPVPKNPAVKSSQIKIQKLVTCSGVSNRQYISPKTVFSLKEESTPVVWMTVLTDNPPFTLTHIYYINGRKYCEVPLEIRYPRMRTWSNVTLNGEHHHGKWRVEVVTESGAILERVEFTVEP